jgi:hypothetical protein
MERDLSRGFGWFMCSVILLINGRLCTSGVGSGMQLRMTSSSVASGEEHSLISLLKTILL